VLVVWTTVAGNSLIALLSAAPPLALRQVRAREALDAAGKQVGAYRQAYSRLPHSLAEVGVPRGEWTYSKGSNGNYTIRLSLQGQVVAFDSLASKERQH